MDRLDFTKTFTGDDDGTGIGLMLSCGGFQTEAAGSVAIETVHGRLGPRDGGFALQQLRMMHDGSHTMHYEVVLGPGHGRLKSINGTFHLRLRTTAPHRYEPEYEV